MHVILAIRIYFNFSLKILKMKKLLSITLSIALVIIFSINTSNSEEYDTDWLVGTSMARSMYFGGNGGLLGIINFQNCCAPTSNDNACALNAQSDAEGCNSARMRDDLIQLRYVD